MHGSFKPGAVRLMYCVALFAVCAAQAAAADFTIAPNISGGFGNFRWDVAIGSAGAVGNPDLTLYTGQTYTFQVNTRARAFYERHGFRVLYLGSGESNEEHQPDVRYAWTP